MINFAGSGTKVVTGIEKCHGTDNTWYIIIGRGAHLYIGDEADLPKVGELVDFNAGNIARR